VWVS